MSRGCHALKRRLRTPDVTRCHAVTRGWRHERCPEPPSTTAPAALPLRPRPCIGAAAREAAPRRGQRRAVLARPRAGGGMNGDDLAELLRALVEEQQAEDAAARAAWELAEAEEADPPRPA